MEAFLAVLLVTAALAAESAIVAGLIWAGFALFASVLGVTWVAALPAALIVVVVYTVFDLLTA